MKKKGFEILGGIFVVSSFIILMNSFQGITGYVVSQRIYGSVGSILGLFLLLIGIALLVNANKLEEEPKVEAGIK